MVSTGVVSHCKRVVISGSLYAYSENLRVNTENFKIN